MKAWPRSPPPPCESSAPAHGPESGLEPVKSLILTSYDEALFAATILLSLIAEGLTNRQIGERMFLAEKTVKNYVSNTLATSCWSALNPTR